MDKDIQELIKLLWVLAISAVGGLVGFITKVNPTLRGKHLKERLFVLMLGIITSGFVGFVTYHIIFYFTKENGISVALSGIAAFSGTDLLVVVQAKLIEVVKRKLDNL